MATIPTKCQSHRAGAGGKCLNQIFYKIPFWRGCGESTLRSDATNDPEEKV